MANPTINNPIVGTKPKVRAKVKQTVSPVKPGPFPAKSFHLPSQKHVVDYFMASPQVQKLYAEHVISVFAAYTSGVIKQYPIHLNTVSDIVNFIYMSRHIKVNETDTLAENFLGLSINPTPSESKRKRENDSKEEQHSKPKQIAKVPVQKDSASGQAVVTPGKWNIVRREKKPMSFALASIPNFLSFFPAARVNVFSSTGGLHDASCGICKEIGHFTAKDLDGKIRSVDVGQKAWIATLHDLIDHKSGLIPNGNGSALLELKRVAQRPQQSVDMETGELVVPPSLREGGALWAEDDQEQV